MASLVRAHSPASKYGPRNVTILLAIFVDIRRLYLRVRHASYLQSIFSLWYFHQQRYRHRRGKFHWWLYIFGFKALPTWLTFLLLGRRRAIIIAFHRWWYTILLLFSLFTVSLTFHFFLSMTIYQCAQGHRRCRLCAPMPPLSKCRRTDFLRGRFIYSYFGCLIRLILLIFTFL